MQSIGKIIALAVLGVVCFLSVSCENMDAGTVSNALGTLSNSVTNSNASAALSTASDVAGSAANQNDNSNQ
jgi:hypothetical protein